VRTQRAADTHTHTHTHCVYLSGSHQSHVNGARVWCACLFAVASKRTTSRHHCVQQPRDTTVRPSVLAADHSTGPWEAAPQAGNVPRNYRARRETVNGFISDQARDATLAPYTLWPCACLSQVGVLSKWMNGSSWLLAETLPLIYPASSYNKQPAFSALTLLAGRQEEHPACKN